VFPNVKCIFLGFFFFGFLHSFTIKKLKKALIQSTLGGAPRVQSFFSW